MIIRFLFIGRRFFRKTRNETNKTPVKITIKDENKIYDSNVQVSVDWFDRSETSIIRHPPTVSSF
jgi:hypothetical protein